MNQPKVLLFIFFLITACSSSPPSPPPLSDETQSAIDELKTLNSKLDVGMNIMEYTELLRNAKASVDKAIESDSPQESNQALSDIMNKHLTALKLWKCSLEDDQYIYMAKEKCRTEIYETLVFPMYPEIKNQAESTKKTYESGDYNLRFYQIDSKKVLQVIWSSTEKDIDKFSSMWVKDTR